MATWRVAVETLDPDPAGRPVPRTVIGHAYDVDAGEPAHPITQGTYRVDADHDWAKSFLGWERCEQCTDQVGRRP